MRNRWARSVSGPAPSRRGPASLRTTASGIAASWIDLTGLARHLALPKSTASVLAKGLATRGFLSRRRDPADERRLQLVLTEEGRRRVSADRVLDPARLAEAM